MPIQYLNVPDRRGQSEGLCTGHGSYVIDSAILGVFILFCGSHPNVAMCTRGKAPLGANEGQMRTEEIDEWKARGEAIPHWLACLVFSTVGLFLICLTLYVSMSWLPFFAVNRILLSSDLILVEMSRQSRVK